MPKRILPLTDMQVLKAKPQDKQITLFDGGGLFLLVTPSLWRFKYRFNEKEKLISLGTYPEISLLEARQLRDEARKQVAHGIDPGAVRKAQKQAETEETETFEVIAREWHTRHSRKLEANGSPHFSSQGFINNCTSLILGLCGNARFLASINRRGLSGGATIDKTYSVHQRSGRFCGRPEPGWRSYQKRYRGRHVKAGTDNHR